MIENLYLTKPAEIVAAAKRHRDELEKLEASLREIQRTCPHPSYTLEMKATVSASHWPSLDADWENFTLRCTVCDATKVLFGRQS